MRFPFSERQASGRQAERQELRQPRERASAEQSDAHRALAVSEELQHQPACRGFPEALEEEELRQPQEEAAHPEASEEREEQKAWMPRERQAPMARFR